MDVSDIEAWCRAGNGGAIGRTLLLPLSSPREWRPSALPDELRAEAPTPGNPLRSAQRVRELMGYPVAVGLAVLVQHPDEPFAHAFNVVDRLAVDLALAGHEPLVYWGYLPSPGQLEVDRLSLAVEAPPASALDRILRANR